MEEIKRIEYYSKLKSKPVDWLWYPYIPYGKITIIQGDPAGGKTSLALYLAMLLTNRKPMPL
ncbi:MAG: AAA family ATPase, partial [Clostridia bacterium]|nr:AAA family ATPase [Clostridia bacterium]